MSTPNRYTGNVKCHGSIRLKRGKPRLFTVELVSESGSVVAETQVIVTKEKSETFFIDASLPDGIAATTVKLTPNGKRSCTFLLDYVGMQFSSLEGS